MLISGPLGSENRFSFFPQFGSCRSRLHVTFDGRNFAAVQGAPTCCSWLLCWDSHMNSLLYSRSSSASRYAPVSLKLSRSLDIGGVKFTARLDKSQQVGCYSVHPSRGPPIVQYDASAIRRYKAPELQADLAIGGHNIIHRFSRPTIRTLDQPSSLDNTLNACLKGHKGARRALMRADVIARQNVIRRSVS